MSGRVVLGKYEVGRFLGRGSMGQVFAARATGGQDVVVKFMHPEAAARPRFRDLFATELQMMARFHHPCAVRLYDGGVDPVAGPCIVMEYVAGQELRELMHQAGRLDAERLAAIVLPLCQAMNAAHAAGIIHRDLKPSNLMVTDPRGENESVKVMDLGLAALAYKPYIPMAKFSGGGGDVIVGTPAYMCPEALRGDDTDARGDLYSIGVLLYEALAGRLPFEDEQVPDLLRAHVGRTPPRFAELGIRDVPPKVEQVILQLLSKYANERPQTPMEVADRYLQALGIDMELNPADFAPHDAAAPITPSRSSPDGSSMDRIVQSMEVWMSEAAAGVKLRTFLENLSAPVVAQDHGLIRARLGERAKMPASTPESRGLFSWLRKAPPAPTVDSQALDPVAIDLYLTHKAGNANHLEIKAVFSTTDGPLPSDPRWHKRIKKIFSDMKGVMANN